MSFTYEIVHENFGELAVPERDDSEILLHISRVHSILRIADRGSQSTTDDALVRAHGLHTLPEYHEGLVDVSCLT